MPDVLILDEPMTDAKLHPYDQQARSNMHPDDSILRPIKLGHVASFVLNLQTMQKFYQETLGFKWSDTIGDFFVFLRCNSDQYAANNYRIEWGPGRHGAGHNVFTYHRDPDGNVIANFSPSWTSSTTKERGYFEPRLWQRVPSVAQNLGGGPSRSLQLGTHQPGADRALIMPVSDYSSPGECR